MFKKFFKPNFDKTPIKNNSNLGSRRNAVSYPIIKSEINDIKTEEKLEPIEEQQIKHEYFSSEFLYAIKDKWIVILAHPTTKILLESIFLQPAYLTFFCILISFILGYFHCSIIWCIIVSCIANFLASKFISKILNNAVTKEKTHGVKHRQEMYPDKESADWVNHIIIAVIDNHNRYISNILLRYLNPFLERFLTIPPINSIVFKELDIGKSPPRISNCAVKLDNNNPPQVVKYDFDVEFITDLQGTMDFKIFFSPCIPILISDLMFKCRMRLTANFYPEQFPFISALQISILERPEIDISVKMWKLPDFLSFPFVTDHYMKVIRNLLYNQIGAPNFLEIDLTGFIQQNEDGTKLVEDIQAALPKVISHNVVESTPQAISHNVAESTPQLNKRTRLSNAVKKIATPLIVRRQVANNPKKQPNNKLLSAPRRQTPIVTENTPYNESNSSYNIIKTKKIEENIRFSPLSSVSVPAPSNTTVIQERHKSLEIPSETPRVPEPVRAQSELVLSPPIPKRRMLERAGKKFKRMKSCSWDENALSELVNSSSESELHNDSQNSICSSGYQSD